MMMSIKPSSEKIIMSSFRPLALAPTDVRHRYAKRAEAAARSYRSAVALKCVECAGWSYAEAKRCQVSTCALWAKNRSIFGVPGKPGAE